MAESAHELHAPFIHYSTDYVFDGTKTSAYTEDDPVNPLNVYGQSKWKAEQAIGQVGGAYVILRASWYSLWGNGFVPRVLSWAREQETLKIVTDKIGSPTLAYAGRGHSGNGCSQCDGLAEVFFREKRLVSFGRGGECFDFTRAILEFDPHPQDQRVKKLELALIADFPTPARCLLLWIARAWNVLLA